MTTSLLSTCDQEPIHMLSMVQPYGLLCTFDYSFRILQITDNCKQIFDQSADSILASPLVSLMQKPLFEKIQFYIEQMQRNKGHLISFSDMYCGVMYQYVLHDCTSHVILEMCLLNELDRIEKYTSAESIFNRAFLEHEKPTSLQDMLSNMAQTVKEISGFDRVLIYKFDENYNGTVLTQKQENFTDDYTGHSFPSSDIPVQARALYLKNRFRVISNVDDESIKLIPNINPITGAPLDMSYCYLRSVSPIHIQYLKNMNIAASMSLSLIVNGKLWGLVVCHHTLPKTVPFTLYESYDLLSQYLSSQIEQKERVLQYRNAFEFRLRRELFFNNLDAKSDLYFLDAIREEIRHTLEILPSDFVVFRHSSQWIKSSEILDDTFCEILLDIAGEDQFFLTSSLGVDYSDHISQFPIPLGGLLVAKIPNVPKTEIFFIRLEKIHIINWAGEPKKCLLEDNGNETVSPRKSFQSWKETVSGTSEPFTKEEIESAQIFSKELSNMIKQYSLYDETRKLRYIEAKQKEQLLQNAIEQKVLKEREMILYSVGEGVYGVDLEGKCFFINHAACEILGYSEQELIGKNTHDLLHHKMPDGSKFPFENCIVNTAGITKVQQSQIDWLIRKNGEHVPVRIIATPILKEDNLTGIVIAFSDITDEYIAQQKLKNLHTELFKLIEHDSV